MRRPDDEDGGGRGPDGQPLPPPLPPQRLPSPPSFLPNFSQPPPSSPPSLDDLLDGEGGFFGTESLSDVRNDHWNNPKFETDYSRPVTPLADKAENKIELILKFKGRLPEPEEIIFSEELSKLFPEANKKMAGQEEKINDLLLRDLEKIFSKTDQGEIPQELKSFVSGRNDAFENRVTSLGISTSSSEFLDFLQSDICADLLKNNKLKVHIESANIYHENTDTNESTYSFFQNQEYETKKWIDIEFILSDDYNDYFMKYFVNIKNGEDEKYDILTNKNSKFLFYHFNDYLRQINKPTKPICHSIVADDDTALEILQNKNWRYFIERTLEACQSNNGGELTQLVSAKDAEIIENSVENLTICKTLYTNFYNQIAGNLSEAIRILP